MDTETDAGESGTDEEGALGWSIQRKAVCHGPRVPGVPGGVQNWEDGLMGEVTATQLQRKTAQHGCAVGRWKEGREDPCVPVRMAKKLAPASVRACLKYKVEKPVEEDIQH